jgi:hypothetical protein
VRQGADRAAVGDAGHEAPVHLEDVDRELAQAGQRRVAGAEVVDGQPHPERLELVQPGSGRVGPADQHGLGDLEDQRPGRQAGGGERRVDVLDQPALVQLAR